jgi:hypothetical protein
MGRAERRDRSRSAVRWTLLLFRDDTAETAETVTENLNCAGFFCFSKMPVACGELLSCVLRIPSWETQPGMPPLTLLCQARVLRVERSSVPSQVGIACRIEHYRCAANGFEF